MRRLLLVVPVVLVAACSHGSQPAPDNTPLAAAPVELSTRGAYTVLQDRDHGPQLCLGGVLTSLPPQCGGPDLVGWKWSALHRADWRRMNGTTWGAFKVTGAYLDGRIAVHHVLPARDPRSDTPSGPPVRCQDSVQKPTAAGNDLSRIQKELSSVDHLVEVGVDRGGDCVRLEVWWDDGSLQRRLDQEYGAGRVLVTSALRPVPRR